MLDSKFQSIEQVTGVDLSTFKLAVCEDKKNLMVLNSIAFNHSLYLFVIFFIACQQEQQVHRSARGGGGHQHSQRHPRSCVTVPGRPRVSSLGIQEYLRWSIPHPAARRSFHHVGPWQGKSGESAGEPLRSSYLQANWAVHGRVLAVGSYPRSRWGWLHCCWGMPLKRKQFLFAVILVCVLGWQRFEVTPRFCGKEAWRALWGAGTVESHLIADSLQISSTRNILSYRGQSNSFSISNNILRVCCWIRVQYLIQILSETLTT